MLAWLACATCAYAAELTPTEVIAQARVALASDPASLANKRTISV